LLPSNLQREALSRAYVHAVAARAGVITSRPDPDLGIDLCLRAVRVDGQHYKDAGVQIDLQLRSTTRALVSETEVRYDLDVRTYDFLREPPVGCPRLLVVLVLPEDEALWLSQSVEELVLRDCAYWRSLLGAAPTTATSSIRNTLERSQVFSVPAVQTLMGRLLQGGAL
jgi:hypothetical protein